MGGTDRRRAAPRETLVRALGLLSAVALAGAAFAPFSDPDLAGRAELARTAGEIADGIVEEWGRMLRDDAPLAAAASETFVWIPGEPPLSAPAEVRVLARDPSRASAFDTLLAESERVELRGDDASSALQLALEATAKARDDAQRAEGRLRSIQLAARVGDGAIAREQWELASGELSGNEARGDTSYLLLCGLAVAPSLEESERMVVARRLAGAWIAGELALPAPRASTNGSEGAPSLALSPEIDALRERLAGLTSDPEVLRLLDEDARRRHAAALADGIGELPLPRADGGWSVRAVDTRMFAWRATQRGSAAGSFVARADLESRFRSRLEAHELVPDGFRVDFGGRDPIGERVRERTALAGDDFGFELRHEDPRALVRRQSRWLRIVRGALFAMALFSLAAGFAIAAALRRERRLAEAKSAFVANVSHELRTPLASILLLAENLESGRARGADAQVRYPALIRREALRLRRLVDDVLDFSRLERGRGLELRIEDTSIAAFLADVGAEARAWAEQNGAGFALRFDLAQASAPLDREAVRRALFNLLHNARKHGGAQGIELGARAYEGQLVLTVRDRGPGIPASRRDDAFEPFVQLGESNGAAPGAGLGLAIVREIALAHGGSVLARDPDEGPGVVLELRLPLSPALQTGNGREGTA